MNGVESHDPRFDHYVLGNAVLEELASGFRWIEGPVWMGDWNCLLFQDLPRNRTMRWSELGGVEVFREPSDYANGQTRDRQERRLYIAETGDQTGPDPKQFIRAYDVAADGRLTGGEVFHKIEPGYADGFRVDEDGNLWSSAADGVHCIDPMGRLLGKILVPHTVSNVTFGGTAKNRLFIGGSHTLYAIFLNRRGVQTP